MWGLRSAAILAIGLLLLGCGGSRDSTGEFYTHWDLAGGCRSDSGGADRFDARGQTVNVCDAVDELGWVWVTYAAGWCNSSRNQAPQIRQFTQRADASVTIFTVLTSSSAPFTDASVADAHAWARSYGLQPEQVLIETSSSRTIPQHLLIGPDGRTWYRYIGFLQTDEMLQLINDFAEGHRYPDVREIRRR